MRGRRPKYRYNEQEQATVDKLFKHGKLNLAAGQKLVAPVEYWEQDNFTVCLIKTQDTNGIATMVGVAKRNPRDRFDEQVGMQVAFAKAVKLEGRAK